MSTKSSKIKFKLTSTLGVAALLGATLTLAQPSALAKSLEKETITEITNQEIAVDKTNKSVEVVSTAVETPELTEQTDLSTDKPTITPLGVDNTASLDLAVGKSWSDSFKMNNWINTDHNAFNVKVSNVTGGGTYKVIITGTNGYSYESSDQSSGNTWTISNAKVDVTYKVTIVNTSSKTVKATVNITSYVK